MKIEVQADSFSLMRKMLQVMGVNHASIFPDIDGLCAHLQWRYSYLDDDDKSN